MPTTMRRVALPLLLLSAFISPSHAIAAPQTMAEAVEIDPNAASHPLPHFWEKMFGSGRAILSLRDDYRHDLRETKRITNFEYIRFHAIFHDEVGLYDANGKPIYNFSYVDQIYDGLLANKVRPLVELSFLPHQLAASNTLHGFCYKPNVSPPKDRSPWRDLVATSLQHRVPGDGLAEVEQ